MTNRKCRQLVLQIAAVLSALAVCSCGNTDRPLRPSYSHFERIPTDGWDPTDIIQFEPWPLDSTETANNVYRMDLVLRYSARNSLESLPLALTIEDGNGETITDTIVIGNGPAGVRKPTWHERTQYGVREVTAGLQEHVRLSDGYAVSISPLIERNNTVGLLNVGLMLTRE